jgi:hypothetical protein
VNVACQTISILAINTYNQNALIKVKQNATTFDLAACSATATAGPDQVLKILRDGYADHRGEC